MVKASFIIYFIVDILVCAVGSLCSLILLMLIWDMTVWGDYIKLIFAMTATQLVYDVFICTDVIFPASFTGFEPSAAWAIIIQLLGGVSSFLISSVISYVVLYVIVKRQTFSVKKNIYIISAFILVPNIVWMALAIKGIYFTQPQNDEMAIIGFELTVFIRLACIVFNVCNYLACYFRIKRMKSLNADTMSNQEKALITLVDRLLWYPIIQAASR